MAIKIIKKLVFGYLTVVFLFQQSAMGKVSGQAAEPQPAGINSPYVTEELSPAETRANKRLGLRRFFRLVNAGKLFGIPFKIEPLTLTAATVFAAKNHYLNIMPVLYGSVIAHELGHALIARTYGVESKQIILHGLGGLDELDFIQAEGLTNGQKVAVSLAGPAVNFAIGGIFLAIRQYFVMQDHSFEYIHSSLDTWLVVSGALNIFNALLNILPIGPLDGGRAANSIMETYMSEKNSSRALLAMSVLATAFLFSPLNPIQDEIFNTFASLGVLIQSVRVLAYEFPDKEKTLVATIKELKEQGFSRGPNASDLTNALENGFKVDSEFKFGKEELKVLINEESMTYRYFSSKTTGFP